MSDLHVDVSGDRYPFKLPDPRPEHDVVVIAGDLRADMVKGVRWIANNGFTKPVLFVPGNHCFYGKAIDTLVAKAKAEAAAHPHIHVMNNDTVTIDGVRFIGATLWTDYKLMRADNQGLAMAHASASMSDHRFIRVAKDDYTRFRPVHALTEHQQSVEYIRTQLLDIPFDGPKVVITHHAPSMQSIDPRHWGDLLNAAYASHLDDLIDRCTLWTHGHTHRNVDYTRGDGRVVTNQRGYPSEFGNGFDPSFVVEIP